MKQKFTGQTVSNKKQKPTRAKGRTSGANANSVQQPDINTVVEDSGPVLAPVTNTNQPNISARRSLQQTDKFQHFGPRASDLRGALASDIEIDLSEVTKPSDVRTLKRI